MIEESLVKKYNTQVPRYTSYPTVPFWNELGFQEKKYIENLKEEFKNSNDSKGVAIYIHLPFCEKLCTFCGCNKIITKDHDLEERYLKAIVKEWQIYLKRLSDTPIVKDLHLGGGTPTFFSADNLKKLLSPILETIKVANNHSFSFEGHPNNTTEEHLKILSEIGFNRVSFGVQDYNEETQQAIQRIQSFESVKNISGLSRKYNYQSVSHDLVYGLPFQNLETMKDLINKTLKVMPDRVSLYSYAHVPWLQGNGQKKIREKDIPKGLEKYNLYLLAKKKLLANGYFEIGMDHFALENDSMYQKFKQKKLHRNFMGYTDNNTNIIFGLGVSSISDCWRGFYQNEKEIEKYYQKVEQGNLPIARGHILSSLDKILRRHILNLMCFYQTDLENLSISIDNKNLILEDLKKLESDGLVDVQESKIIVTKKGIPFIRNICMAFDEKVREKKNQQQIFSQSV